MFRINPFKVIHNHKIVERLNVVWMIPVVVEYDPKKKRPNKKKLTIKTSQTTTIFNLLLIFNIDDVDDDKHHSLASSIQHIHG